ncbi:hypothetical protein [Desulfopila aestuarii]|uniref:Cytochrome c554 and c-prime n=1 Tax=Desulfopila aestuarii DSM 18488 TaxID=1121416 RepID=A0A1M7Y7H9_9BACT|nr:hypothetical protein [Desulfopila aestuarii]SHO48541.1 Cytochrome c554 and c-prime [Desulfopila aestuarii DSM 18488]
MIRFVVTAGLCILLASNCYAEDRNISMSATPAELTQGETVQLNCKATGEWRLPLRSATITIVDGAGQTMVSGESMAIDRATANYNYTIPVNSQTGNWSYKCVLRDRSERERSTSSFAVTETTAALPPVVGPPEEEPPVQGPIADHNTITSYNGPATCIACHQKEADDMLNSLHMQWSGPTPDLINTNGEALGKAKGGINTFCTYAPSSKGACYSCHVRADGNAPHPPEATDVDCLMCHNDTYQRTFESDPSSAETVTNILGEEKTYVFGKVDGQGNYLTKPDFAKMPAGTTMVNLARTVHLPTTKSCLRCHAKAGGGDWTKRGDMGINSASATKEQDVHLAKDGANLSCVNCHAALDHKISGRGIDLRQTEADRPTCKACHTDAPHQSSTLNNHARGQVSCQVCHIREFAKGGATEMARDWRIPVWNQAFCSGQGGFVGEETKESNVKPEYVWFDGTSYVYNVGETISPDENGMYVMAKAHGSPFDGKSSIVPIKRHGTIMPLHESGKIIPPAIMWMFMTGDFDLAVVKGMEEQGMTGNYTLVEAEAEMLITHGVEPKGNAPTCTECHSGNGATPDGTRMLPFTALGYHEVPAKVLSCTLCHEQKSMSWQSMHTSHKSDGISCTSCHTPEPTGLVKSQSVLCSSCHERKSWRSEGHKKHIEKGFDCVKCHTFS